MIFCYFSSRHGINAQIFAEATWHGDWIDIEVLYDLEVRRSKQIIAPGNRPNRLYQAGRMIYVTITR